MNKGRFRVAHRAVDRLAERAREDGDALALEALGEISKELRKRARAPQNKLASTSSPPPAVHRETDSDVYNRIHTKALPWGIAMSQVATAALIRLSSAPLWRDEAAVEGATFLINNIICYTLPAIAMLSLHPERISAKVKLSIAFIFLGTLSFIAFLEWLGF